MSLSLKDCERLTGLSRSALQKAIKIGKLSASSSDSGSWLVDPYELSRVYTVTPDTTSSGAESVLLPPHIEVEKLRAEVTGLENLVLALTESTEDLRVTAKDLRERLTAAEQERNKLTLMLTHQTSHPVTGKSQTGNRRLVALIIVLSGFLVAGVAWVVHFNQVMG